MATSFDCVQLMSEETPRPEGAATTTPYRLSSGASNFTFIPAQNARISPAPQFLDRGDEMRGIDGAVPMLLDTFLPDGAINIRFYPSMIIWLLQASGLTGVGTAGDGAAVKDPDNVSVPVGVTRWVFTKRPGLTAKTFQVQACYVNEGVFLKGQGFGVSSLGLTSDGSVTAALEGLVVAKQTDPNLTPAFDSQVIPHFRRGDISLTWLSGSGTTDDFNLTIDNSLVRRRTMALATPSYFPDVMEQGDARVRMHGSIPKSKFAVADYDALVAATTFAAKVKWLSPKVIGATAAKYSCWVEMPACQYSAGGPDQLSNVRRKGASFDWWAAWDETSAYDFKITILNATPQATWETLV